MIYFEVTGVRNRCFVCRPKIISHIISSAYGLTSDVFATDDALPVRNFLCGGVHPKATLIFIAAV